MEMTGLPSCRLWGPRKRVGKGRRVDTTYYEYSVASICRTLSVLVLRRAWKNPDEQKASSI